MGPGGRLSILVVGPVGVSGPSSSSADPGGGRSFAGQTSREEDDEHMFNDKGGQYFDKAERGDQSDPNISALTMKPNQGKKGWGTVKSLIR